MSPKSQSNEKKRFSLVRKPFLKGTVNLFHPPKRNPNGHLASAKLLHDELCLESDRSSSEEIGQDLECLEELNHESVVENPDIQVNRFFNSWKIATVSIIVFGNILGAVAISLHQQKAQSLADTIENSQEIVTAGNSDLTAKEFVSLDLHSLKNIAVATDKETAETDELEETAENLPLAIPPTNLPQDAILPQAKNDTQYYYILTEYTGDRSLAVAKTKVPHVSLINFPQGVFIYMGAFAQQEPARQFIKQLKELGLEGYIYPFEASN